MIRKFDNQNENYPIVLIPDNIYNLLHSEIDESTIASDLNITKPEKVQLIKPPVPTKYTYEKRERIETQLTEHSGCIPIVILGSIVLSFFVADSFIEGLQFILYGTVGYLVFFSILLLFDGKSLIKFKSRTDFIKVDLSIEEFNKLDNEYKEKLNKYNSNYKSAERNYELELEKYWSKINTNKNTIKKKLYLQNLRPQISSSRGSLSLKRGAAELKFLEQLDSELKALIFVDMVPRLDWAVGKNTYNPDLTLICKHTNLHIDIEIDEPYSISEKLPIHHIGSSDDRRNEFFLNNNWCIIRFSERQIIENTVECIKTIKSIYNNLIEMNTSYSTSLNIEERWTYEDSLIMQKNRYREKYLN